MSDMRERTPADMDDFTPKEQTVMAAQQPPITGTMRFWLGELDQIFFGQASVGRMENQRIDGGVGYEFRGGVILPDGKHLQTDWHPRPCQVFWELREKWFDRYPPHGECKGGFYTTVTEGKKGGKK